MEKTYESELKRINRTLLISWLTIIIILLSAYSIEVIKQERTLGYIIEFAIVMLVPYFATAALYVKKKDWEYLGYAVVVGYSVMYSFVMFTGATQMVSSYILPLLIFLVLYHKPILIAFSFIVTMFINICSLIYQLEQSSITVSNSKDVEIRFAVIIVSFAGGFIAARLYDSIHNDNKRYMKELSEKNKEIQDMAIQTIATIANTIDAKDEYTKGHSKRVSEYAVTIARELGMTPEEVSELRSVALLHDIGKIGVPDSVLNKPGRLTDDEYELMKQHTLMGADILKDIKLLQGIDIGAKYHHERYDGKGYPEKKAGEEIPKIARIIAVADAFDAMTSNRVYRKQLDLERVIGELKRCRGTQFDPQMADALVRMLEEKRLEPIVIDESEKQSDVSKIWSRVIEKDEKKYLDKSVADELTGLYGRNYGEQMIREAVENNMGALIILDVDHFRKINGEAGYLFGDIILRSLSRCLERIENDKILARYGGDEFVVFLPNMTQRESVKEILDSLYSEIKQERKQLNETVRLTLSAGVCICAAMKNIYQECFLDADRALYMSKRDGGDRYTFYEKHHDEDRSINGENADLLRLKQYVEKTDENGDYDELVSPEINNAVKLIKQLINNSENPLQVILFTAKTNEGISVSIEEHNTVMEYLETAILRSIKGMDYTVRFSNTQRMIILTKSPEDGALAVSTHVMKEFYKLYNKKKLNVSYDTIEFV